MPKYILEKDFNLSEEEYNELDSLARLLLDIDNNFWEIQNIWNNELKYRIRKGVLN